MTDLREKLADVICSSRAVDNLFAKTSDYDLADAIIAALPDMVVPLVWEEDSAYGWKRGRVTGKDISGNRYVIVRSEHGWAYMGDYYLQSHDNLDDALNRAKAAANAHHRATILAAFGVQGETA